MVRFAAAVIALAVTSLGLAAHGAESEILLLDFWSPHCGPCMQMKPTVHSFIQARYPIREVDTTQDQQTTRQFNIDRIPCFVMLVDGMEVERHVGAISTPDLQQMFEKAKDRLMEKRRARGQDPNQLQPGRLTTAGTLAGPASRPDAPRSSADPWSNSAAPPTTPAPTPKPVAVIPVSASGNDFPPSLMSATVRIRVDDSQGRSFGTGTIIDARSGEALIVTCGHLFRESQGKGPMTVELFDVGSNGPRVAEQLPGQLISYDIEREVALVSIKTTRQISVAAVAPTGTNVQRGDRVATIGCSNGQDPTLLSQRVNQLDRYAGPPNIEVSGAPEEGRSGGGLFNLQGQLIGVCYAADYEGKEGLYTALESIHRELDRLKLTDVYAKSPPSPAASPEPIVRGQVPADSNPTLVPLGSQLTPPTNANNDLPNNLKPEEQAAFGEIMSRATNSEVVIIVRPKTPGGQSDVITIDNVSPEFIKALEARKRNAAVPAVPIAAQMPTGAGQQIR